MSAKKWKYTARFEDVIHASSDLGGMQLSEASLDSLQDLIPEDVDLDRNIDLMAVAFNAAVINKFNRNGDGISTEAAINIKDLFIHKPTNIEHDKDQVVGHIVSSAFSKFDDSSDILSIADVADGQDAFNLSLGAVVYRTVNSEFAELLESSNEEDSDYYMSVSASWEIGFNDYALAVGSDDLKNAAIISDATLIEELSKHLKSFGGNGKLEDGTPIHRLIVGEIYPLGIGFTTNPAADVQGVYVKKDKDEEESGAKVAVDEVIRREREQQEKSSLSDESNVIQENQQNSSDIMDTEKLITEFKELLDEKMKTKDFSEDAVASITKVFHDAIKERSEDYVEEVEKAKAEKEESETAREAMVTQVSDLEEKLQSTEDKLQALEEDAQQREATARFNARMESVDSTYDLSDEDRTIVAAEINGLDDTDESFAAYQEKLTVVWKHKSKEFIEQLAKEMEDKIQSEVEKRLSTASTDETTEQPTEEVAEEISTDAIEEVLDQVEAATDGVVNNNGESVEREASLRDRFAKAFKDSVKFTF
ncbi:hypothetical protein CL634_04095 [bacterium]|nr:hypothetical protein [bacterium]|tara:strand:+ start:13 stop:1620 length:1608 start_codon:yes stop_codon:yes gene_type:complete